MDNNLHFKDFSQLTLLSRHVIVTAAVLTLIHIVVTEALNSDSTTVIGFIYNYICIIDKSTAIILVHIEELKLLNQLQGLKSSSAGVYFCLTHL